MAFSRPLAGIRPIRLDTAAAIAGLALAVLLFPLRFVASQIYIETIPIVLGGACALYLLAAHYDQRSLELPTLSRRAAMSLPSVAIVGLATMVVATVFQGERTHLFFGLASVVGTLVFVQILFTSDRDFNRGVVLLQLVLFAFVFRYTALYATPGLVGIDGWTHVTDLAHAIYESGSLGAISEDKHYASPFYHLLVVASTLLYGVSLKSALYLSVGVVMPLSILLVYTTTNLLIPARWATLAAAFYGVANYVSLWGIHLIPTSLGLVFFLAMLYALIRVMRIEYTVRDFSLLILLSVAVILTHQVSTFIMLVLLLAAFLAQLVFVIGPFGLTRLDTSVFRAKKPVNLVGLVIFNVGLTIFVWSLTPYRRESFLATVLSWLGETLADSAGFLNLASPSASSGGGGESAAPTLLDQVVAHVEVLGFLVLLGATFAGCLYVVHRRRAEQSVFTLLLAAAIMLVFVLGLPMFGIRNFIPTRWFAFLYAPMAILGAVGVRTLTRDLSSVFVVVLVLLALVYPGAMILAPESNVDNPVFPDHHEQLAYDEPELAAAQTIGEMTGSPSGQEIRPDQVLYTDHPYKTMISRTHAYPADTATIVDGEPADHEYVVYRTKQSTDATYFVDANGYGQIRDVPRDRLCRPSQASVYTNGDVTMCVSSSASA